MVDREFDTIVMGGGPGGYVCAIRLGQLGQKTLCIEEDEVGGVCLNWGCIPSKALIANAHFYSKAQTIGAHGINLSGVSVDSNKMQDWKDGIVKKLTTGVRGLLKANGADLLEGTATACIWEVPVGGRMEVRSVVVGVGEQCVLAGVG